MPSNEVLRQRLQSLAQFANNHRLTIYTFVSGFSLAAVVANALKNYSNFYSVAIYLSKSSRSVLVRLEMLSTRQVYNVLEGSSKLWNPSHPSVRASRSAHLLWSSARQRGRGKLQFDWHRVLLAEIPQAAL